MPSKESREAAARVSEWVKKQTWYQGAKDDKKYVPSAEEILKYEAQFGKAWEGPRPEGMPAPKVDDKKDNNNFF